jgi:hypothetical protein
MSAKTNQEGASIDSSIPKRISIGELAKQIHHLAKFDGEWDVIDKGDPMKRTMISPPLSDNRGKIVDMAIRLLTISKSEIPQNRDSAIVGVLYDLLDFCQAHNYDIEGMLNKIISEHE